uniref:Ovule protein n=1 Tax=Syphacia muris TaxID=451379 RepID=A0A0N5ARK2_9BILA
MDLHSRFLSITCPTSNILHLFRPFFLFVVKSHFILGQKVSVQGKTYASSFKNHIDGLELHSKLVMAAAGNGPEAMDSEQYK